MKKIPLRTNQNNPAIQAYKQAVEKGRKDQHILPSDDGWVVKNLLSGMSSQTFGTQQEATIYAKSTINSGASIFIHGVDGRIIDRRDY